MTIQYLPSRGKSSRFSFTVDEKDIARIKAKLQRASGLSLNIKTERAMLAVADTVAGKVRAAAPRRTGLLRASVKARREARGASVSFARAFGVATTASTAVLIGPTSRAPHRHLVIRGHRIVTPGGRDTGRRSIANPFVDRASAGVAEQARRAVEKEWGLLLR